MLKRIWIILLFLCLLGPTGHLALAQNEIIQWPRYETTLTLQQNGAIRVEETHEISLVAGATTWQRTIPTEKLSGIQDIQVVQVIPTQRTYQQADTQDNYTFEVTKQSNHQIIDLHFPPNNVTTSRFILRYTVTGGIRFYPEGDWLVWQPFGRETTAPIKSLNTVVRFPVQLTEKHLIYSTSGLDTVKSFFSEGNRIIFTTTNIPAGSRFEIDVRFPHGIIEGKPPRWQQTIDSEAFWSPVLLWGGIGLGLMLVVVGPLGALGWWSIKLRIPPDRSRKTPKYYKSPPGKLPPALAGVLLDGKTNPRHIAATMLDLARRGAFAVEPDKTEEESLLPDDEEEANITFILHSLNEEEANRSFERTLYSKLFGRGAGRKSRKLSELRQSLYMAAPELKTQIDLEINRTDFFDDTVANRRRRYIALGGSTVLMSIVFGVLITVLLSDFSSMVSCPFVGLVITGLAVIAIGIYLPKRTETGQRHAHRWQALKRYLKDMDTERAAGAEEKFDHLLVYAVAFGLDKKMVDTFESAQAHTPTWWGKPPEQAPDLSVEGSHAWVSSAYTEEKTADDMAWPGGGPPLLQNAPEFRRFLKEVSDIFGKAPSLEDTDSGVELPPPSVLTGKTP